jgi:hypothetical protein
MASVFGNMVQGVLGFFVGLILVVLLFLGCLVAIYYIGDARGWWASIAGMLDLDAPLRRGKDK